MLSGISTVTSMHPSFWPLLLIQSTTGNYVYSPAPRIDVRAERAAELCDVRQIMRRSLKGLSTWAQRMGHVHVRLVVAQVAGQTWNFDMFLVHPVQRRWPWRLSASTCALTAERAAIKLGFLAPSLSWSTPPPRPEVRPIDSVLAPASAPPTPPAVQRPRSLARRPVQPPVVATRSAAEVPEPPAGSTSCLAPVVVPATPPRPTRAGAARLRVRAEARVAHGVLPQGVAGGVRVVAAAFGRHVRTEFGATFDYAGSFTMAGDPRVRYPGRVAARVSFCHDLVVHSVDLHLCAGMDAGLILMKSTDVTAKSWMVHVHASPGLTWWFHPQLGLFGGLSAGPALARPRFYIGPGPGDDAQLSQTMPREFLEAALGLEIRFSIADRQSRSSEVVEGTPRRH